MSYKKFLKMLDSMIGSENGKTVKRMAQIVFGEVNKKTRAKIHSYLYHARNDKNEHPIPIWSHKIPKSKEKLYYQSITWVDFNDTHSDLSRRITLSLHHGMIHEKRARTIGLKQKVRPRKLNSWQVVKIKLKKKVD